MKKVYIFDHSKRTSTGGFPVFVGVEDEEGNPKSLKILSPKISQRLMDHSPDGFNWGYGGSGPAQCALGVLLDFTRDKNQTLRLYHEFKDEVIAHIPTDTTIIMHADKLNEWIDSKKKEGLIT